MNNADLSTLVEKINALTANQRAVTKLATSLAEYAKVIITCLKQTQDVLLDYNLRLDQLEKAQTQKGENDEQE